MQIPEKEWQQSDISSVLTIFPGVLGEFLQETTPQQILRAEKFLPYIFWRWYFLEQESSKIPPYYYLDWRRAVEDWPKSGQFFPKPSVKITNTNTSLSHAEQIPALQFDITVDYIAFDEQPIIVDTIRNLQKTEPLYSYSKPYNEAVQKLAAECKTEQLTIESIRAKPMLLLQLYVKQSLLIWREADPFIKNSFSANQWISFWKMILLQGGKKKGLNTDDLLDDFVSHVRMYFPGYGIKSKDLEKISGKDDIDDHVKVQYYFWLNTAYYVLIPFSMYAHLIAPLFISQDMFREDVRDFLTMEFIDPMPAYAPCTNISLTPFGKRLFEVLK